MAQLRQFLSEFDSHKFVKSNIITDPLPKEIKKIAACNIDVDIFDAVESALEKVSNLIVVGGIIILEDGGHTPALLGAHCAVEKFMKTSEGKRYHKILLSSGQTLLIKLASVKRTKQKWKWWIR